MGDFDWLGPAIQAGSSLLSGVFNRRSQEDAQDKQIQAEREKSLQEIELERLKYEFGLKGASKGGGGRGGGSGGGGGVDPRKLQIEGIQNLMGTNDNNQERLSRALTNLATLMQRGYLGGA